MKKACAVSIALAVSFATSAAPRINPATGRPWTRDEVVQEAQRRADEERAAAQDKQNAAVERAQALHDAAAEERRDAERAQEAQRAAEEERAAAHAAAAEQAASDPRNYVPAWSAIICYAHETASDARSEIATQKRYAREGGVVSLPALYSQQEKIRTADNWARAARGRLRGHKAMPCSHPIVAKARDCMADRHECDGDAKLEQVMLVLDTWNEYDDGQEGR